MSEILTDFAPECPAGWTTMAIGDVLVETDRPIDMHDSVLYRLASVRRRNGGMFHRESLPGRKILTKTLREVVPGSFVIARMQVVHGACTLVPDEFAGYAISKSYSSFLGRPNCDIRFFAHLARQAFMRRLFLNASHGVVIEKMTFDQSRWLSFPIHLPPLEEQRRIADILDTIDDAIQSSERALAKRERLGSAVVADIIRAVVEGAPTADCGSVLEIQSGVTLNPSRAPRSNPVGYLRVANVHRDLVLLDDVAQLEATSSERTALSLREGDLLVVEGHANPDEIGRCAMVPQEAAGLLFQNHLFRLRPGEIDPGYALQILNSEVARRYWRRACATSSGLYTINRRQLSQLPIPVVSKERQREVARHASRASEALAVERAGIEKLRSVRLGLASDLLSGRVKSVA